VIHRKSVCISGLWATLLAVLIGSHVALAQTPLGGEFQINSYAPGFQARPQVAAGPNGEMVVVWSSSPTLGLPFAGVYGTKGQRYDVNGNSIGSEFQVSAYEFLEDSPALTVADDGSFVVVWNRAVDQYANFSDIKARRFDAAGNPIGVERTASTLDSTSGTGRLSVALDPDDAFALVFHTRHGNVLFQGFDDFDNPVGPPVQINAATLEEHFDASIATDVDGNFLVVWRTFFQNSFIDSVVLGRRFDVFGNPIGAEFQISTVSSPGLFEQVVTAFDASGGFVVAYPSTTDIGTDDSGFSIHARRYDSSSSPLGPVFQVNTYTAGDQDSVALAVDADGSFVLVWESDGSSGSDTSSSSVQGQRYGPAGNPVESEFQINSYTTSFQGGPSVALDGSGGFFVAWSSDGGSGPDSFDTSIQGQRFSWLSAAVPVLAPFGLVLLAAGLLGGGVALARGRR
jgi:hypothetical protein